MDQKTRTMKKTILLLTLCLGFLSLQAQDKFFTRTGHITFFSEAPLENIEASNHQVTSILNVKTGDLVFSVLMKGFEFEKALMQEHFNETYVESHKFPKTQFKGKIDNFSEIDLSKDGTYPVKVSGEIDMHGVKKNYSADGELVKSGDKIEAKSKFKIKVTDHGVKIPAGKMDNIAETVDVTVEMNYEPYGK